MLCETEAERRLYDIGTYVDCFSKPDVKVKVHMRRILVDWMTEAADSMDMCSDALYLAVRYLDAYLCVGRATVKALQLIGATCLWVAAKFADHKPPALNRMMFLCSDLYLDSEAMEEMMLDELKFRLNVPTVMTFLRLYLAEAHRPRAHEEIIDAIRASHTAGSLSRRARADASLQFYAELSVLCYPLQLEKPSDLAAGIVVLAYRGRGTSDSVRDILSLPPFAALLTQQQDAEFIGDLTTRCAGATRCADVLGEFLANEREMRPQLFVFKKHSAVLALGTSTG